MLWVRSSISDLSLGLQQAASQLPVSSYFDEALLRREQELLFARGPRYVGHALSVPERGAIPHVLTLSTLHPASTSRTLNLVEFYYPEAITAFEREFIEAQQATHMETCAQDDKIAECMDAGRKALCLSWDNEVGPCPSPMEHGMQHFHECYRNAMGVDAPQI